MKKKILSLCILPFLLPLTSCAKEVTGTCYYQDVSTTFAYGNLYLKTDVRAYNDTVKTVNIDATYSPSVWARISEKDATALGEGNYFSVENAPLFDGTKGTVYYPTYIQIGNTYYQGHARTKDETAYYASAGEVALYSVPKASDESDTSDLTRYFNTTPTDTYKLNARIESYYSDVTSGKIKIVKKNGDSYVSSSLTPAFPNNSPLLSASPNLYPYFATALKNFKTFVEGKAINYAESFKDNRKKGSSRHRLLKNQSGSWYYNDWQMSIDWENKDLVKDVDNHWVDTGISSSDFCEADTVAFFTTANNAFASVEYASVR